MYVKDISMKLLLKQNKCEISPVPGRKTSAMQCCVRADVDRVFYKNTQEHLRQTRT